MRYLNNLTLWVLLAGAAAAAMAPLPRPAAAEHDWSAEAQVIVDQQVADLTRGRDCTVSPRLVDDVLVRNARQIDGDTAVVRVVTFDQAYAAATRGDVVVLRYCA